MRTLRLLEITLKRDPKHEKINEGSLKMSRRLVSSSIDVW